MFDRRLFYLDICESFLTGKLDVTDRQLTAQIASLIAYVEMRGISRMTGPQIYKDWLPVSTQWHTDSEMNTLISTELSKLSGMSKDAAEYRLIQTVDSLLMYGACYHTARNSAGESVNIAATTTGIVFFCENWKQLNRYVTFWVFLQLWLTYIKARFPLPELTARVDGWPVSITRQDGACVSTSRVDGPSTRIVEMCARQHDP